MNMIKNIVAHNLLHAFCRLIDSNRPLSIIQPGTVLLHAIFCEIFTYYYGVNARMTLILFVMFQDEHLAFVLVIHTTFSENS